MHDTSRTAHATEVTVLAAFIQRMAMFATLRGVTRDAIHDALGYGPEALLDPERHLHAEGPRRLLALLEARFPHEALGLTMAGSIPPSTFGALTYACRHCRTIGATFPLLQRYVHTVSSHLSIEALADGLAFRHAAFPDSPTIMEASVAHTWRQLIALGLSPSLLARVELAHAPRDALARYEEFFGQQPAFGAPRYALRLHPDALDQPIQGADPNLYRFITTHLESYRPNPVPLTDDTADLEAAILQAGEDGAFSVEAVADALGTSVRTLQRRARDAGTTLSDLLNRHRQRRAEALLHNRRLSIDDVAFLVGYADERSFNRAFRRWTGHTPAAYRRNGTA